MVVWAGLAILACFSAPAAFGNSLGVTNTNDSGPGSLRNAIASAAPGDTIYFNPKAMRLPATITLASTLYIANLTIIGPGASLLFITGGGSLGPEQLTLGSFFVSGVVSISGVTIQNTNATSDNGVGGAIWNDGTLTISNSTLSGNIACLGGAIYNQGTLTLINSTLSDNSGCEGGGIYNFGTVTVSGSTISGNSARGGGGIVNEGTLTVINSTLSGNSAASGGGIYNDFEMTATLTNSTLSGNSATQEGGAIHNQGTLMISNSTLSGNSSGGISIDSAVLSLPSNFAPYFGPIYSSSSQVGITLKSTIIANSTQGQNCSVAFGTVTSLGYNLSDDPSCASYFNQPGDMNSTAAGLDPAGLNSNGGPTRTIALLPTSVAVDAIPISACTDAAGNPVTTDQRGVARPQGRACDIGAFELVLSGALGRP